MHKMAVSFVVFCHRCICFTRQWFLSKWHTFICIFLTDKHCYVLQNRTAACPRLDYFIRTRAIWGDLVSAVLGCIAYLLRPTMFYFGSSFHPGPKLLSAHIACKPLAEITPSTSCWRMTSCFQVFCPAHGRSISPSLFIAFVKNCHCCRASSGTETPKSLSNLFFFSVMFSGVVAL